MHRSGCQLATSNSKSDPSRFEKKIQAVCLIDSIGYAETAFGARTPPGHEDRFHSRTAPSPAASSRGMTSDTLTTTFHLEREPPKRASLTCATVP